MHVFSSMTVFNPGRHYVNMASTKYFFVMIKTAPVCSGLLIFTFLFVFSNYVAEYNIIGENRQQCSSWFGGIKIIKPSYGKCYLT
jgi:hypothetical protein